DAFETAEPAGQRQVQGQAPARGPEQDHPTGLRHVPDAGPRVEKLQKGGDPMTGSQAAVYGAVQGLTEFLPVSSSAHLNLLPWLLNWEDTGLSFDVALHIGTLAALLGYFWKDWLEIFSGAVRDPRSAQARLLAF